jgi:acetyl esterase/lipase
MEDNGLVNLNESSPASTASSAVGTSPSHTSSATTDPGSAAQTAIDAASGRFFPAPSADAASAPLILVLPGGGYTHHADHEAEAIAEWLNSAGLNAYVYRYPLAPAQYPAQIVATREVLASLRRGEEGDYDSSRIGVIGFSAGGHLAAMLSNAPTVAELSAHQATGDLTEAEQYSRPDLAILSYAVTSMVRLPNQGSLDALLGQNPALSLRTDTSAEGLVDAETPATFLWHTAEDTAVPLPHALRYAEALMLHGVPVDLHVYAEGAHGAGLAQGRGPLEGWSGLAIEWLRHQGW